MKILTVLFTLIISMNVTAQQEGDTLFSRCPVAVTDTSGYNNYFTSHQGATVKVERIRNKLVITIQQKEQFFTMFFKQKKLSEKKYSIVVGADDKDELDAKYSFRAGGRASFINVNNGTVNITYNEEKQLWNLKINGVLKNLEERTVRLYKVKADISFK